MTRPVPPMTPAEGPRLDARQELFAAYLRWLIESQPLGPGAISLFERLRRLEHAGETLPLSEREFLYPWVLPVVRDDVNDAFIFGLSEVEEDYLEDWVKKRVAQHGPGDYVLASEQEALNRFPRELFAQCGLLAERLTRTALRLPPAGERERGAAGSDA